RQGGADLGEGRQEAGLPPLRVPGRPQAPLVRRPARPAAGGGRAGRGARDAAEGPTRPEAAQEAEGLRRALPPARRATAPAARSCSRAGADLSRRKPCPNPSSSPPAVASRQWP